MNEIYVPVLHFFENGNSFTGSSGMLRFFVKPEEEQLRVMLWRGELCLEKSEVECEHSFPLSQEGRDSLLRWLEEKRGA